MRRTVFLDTSYLLALIRKRDAQHEAALTALANHAGPFITTDLVLVELANSLSQPPYRATVVAIIDKMRTDRNTRKGRTSGSSAEFMGRFKGMGA